MAGTRCCRAGTLKAVRLLFAAALAVWSWTAACDAVDPAVSRQSAIVYGTDDRREYFEETDLARRDLARRASVALIPAGAIDFSTSPALALRAPPLSAYQYFCKGTRYLEQPSAARCSGVVIDDDLVLTAAHCFDLDPTCRGTLFLFDDLYTAPATRAPLDRGKVFGCRRIAAKISSPPDATEQVDFAVVQLDRAVGDSRAPLRMRTAPLIAGEPIATFGYPEGVPLKIDGGGAVHDVRAATLDYFTATTDTFRGSSGGPLVDGDGNVVGILARGGDDYVQVGSCMTARVAGPAAAESATYAARAVDALCGADWPSQRICGVAPSCGDGICSSFGPAPEDPSSCPGDCTAAACGDGLCEPSEWDACGSDCGDRRPAGIPNGWFCTVEWFADGSTCDCACGATDPDCGDPAHPKSCDSVGPSQLAPRGGGGGCSVPGQGAPPAPVLILNVAACLLARRVGWSRR
ncbi:MAG TPA: serine protease [Mycobacterium sp.]|nr:serine protease [Mycobacterium sp.]